METQKSLYDLGHGIDVRDFPRFTYVLSGIFTKLTDEERIAYAALNLCDAINPEIVRYDHDLCSLCVGPIVLDRYMEDAQSAKFFVSLITEKDPFVNEFREFLMDMLNANQSGIEVRERMLKIAKDTLESRMIEGFF